MSAVAVILAATVAVVPPAPSHWVEDHAGLMSSEARDALDARLAGYERATGHQVVVWIDHTLGGAALDDWAVRTFAAWKVGRAGLDDGVAMFVFADDHTIDLEVGYGLEAQVPDAIAARIIRDVMAPRLRAGAGDAAIREGADAVLAAIEGHAWRGAPGRSAGELDPVTLIVGGLAGVAFLILLITHPRLALLLWMFGGRGLRGGPGGGGGGFGGRGGRSGGGGGRGGW